jgi:hypothetical protein
MAKRIAQATGAISDKRKRDSVDKAAAELFRRMTAGQVPPALLTLVQEFAAKLNTPAEAKAAWKVINDNHFEDVKPFLNIKFLV